jgi:transcriptional regulator with XRE-family HTH domain
VDEAIRRACNNVAANVRRLRGLRGWTQKELAKRTGVTEGEMGKFESGRRALRTGTIARLAAALGVEVHELLVPSLVGASCRRRGVRNPIERVCRDVAENVYRLRGLRGWTQAGLAERMGTTSTVIRRFETENRELRLGTLLRLAVALDVEPEALLMPATRTPKRRPGRPPRRAATR